MCSADDASAAARSAAIGRSRRHAAGYMSELNVLCGIADYSTQSEQPVTKHLIVEISPAERSTPP
jgi:hypothetical protein